MENGVNVEGHPPPSTPTTTGLAWNKANSLFVNTGNFSPVTAGMFLSLVAEGANSASSNEQMSPDCALLMERHRTIDQLSIKSPRKQIFKNAVSSAYVKNKKQKQHVDPTQDSKQSPPKAGPSVKVGKPIKIPKSKHNKSLKPRRQKFNWKTATAITFESREMAQAFITTHYPLLHKRTKRGVSPQDVLVLNSVMKYHSKLKPKAMAGESSPELRSQLGKKLKSKIKHQFVRERKLGTRSSNVTNLKDLAGIKGSIGFTLPQQANTSIQSEEDLKGWGSSLFDLGCLRVAPCEGVTNCRSQAYNLMAVLQPE
eukprot:jgi/Psemu1/36017/gm1.36017_g